MGLFEFLGIGKKRKQMIEEALANGAIIVDVRTVGEYRQGHVEGSINISLDTIAGKVKKLKKMNKPILLCCASGIRSASATFILKKNGIECYNAGSWHRINKII